MSTNEEIHELLTKDLDGKLLSKRKLFRDKNKEVEYLEGHVVIDQANRIFGFDGWGYESKCQALTLEWPDKKGKVRNAYMASVTVTVLTNESFGPVSRQDVGFAVVPSGDNGESPDGHETAFKGAVTDGLKRAFRTFGVQFGNSLYGDDHDSEPSGSAPTSGSGQEPAPTSEPTDNRSREDLLNDVIAAASEKGWNLPDINKVTKKNIDKGVMDCDVGELRRLLKSIESWREKGV